MKIEPFDQDYFNTRPNSVSPVNMLTCYHYAKFEYKGMKAVGVTDYTQITQ